MRRLLILALLLALTLAGNTATWRLLPTDVLLDSADLVVVGTIVAEEPGPIRTWEATDDKSRYHYTWGTLKISETLFGTLPAKGVKIEYQSFPHDSAFLSRKLGQKGVWILTASETPGVYTAGSPWDYEPPSRRPVVERALRKIADREYGEDVEGLSMFIEVEKAKSPANEEHILYFGLRNSGQSAVELFPDAEIVLDIQDRTGRIVSGKLPVPERRKNLKVEPGRVYRPLFPDIKVPLSMTPRPGEYRTRLSYLQNSSSKSAPQAPIVSPWRELEVTPAVSDLLPRRDWGYRGDDVRDVEPPVPFPRLLVGGGRSYSLAFDSSGRKAASSGAVLTTVWNLEPDTHLGSVQTVHTESWVNLLEFSRESEALIQGDGELYPFATGRVTAREYGAGTGINGLAIDRDSQLYLTRKWWAGPSLRLEKVGTSEPNKEFQVEGPSDERFPICAAVSGQAGLVAAVSLGKEFTAWSWPEGKVKARKTLDPGVKCVAIRNSDGLTVLGDTHGRLRFPLETERPDVPVSEHEIHSLEWSDDGKALLATTAAEAVVLDGQTFTPLYRQKDTTRATLSPDAQSLLTVRAGNLELVDVQTGKRRLQFPQAASAPTVTWRSNSEIEAGGVVWDLGAGVPRVAAAGSEERKTLWSQGSWTARRTGDGLRIQGPTSEMTLPVRSEVSRYRKEPKFSDPRDVSFSPDGTLLGYTTQDGYATLLTLATGQTQTIGRAGDSASISFPNQGERIAICDSEAIWIWNLKESELVQKIKVSERIVTDAAFHPTLEILALAHGDEGLVTLWDTHRGKKLASLVTLALDDLEWAAFTPDGRFDGTTRALELVSWVDGDDVRTLTSEGEHRPGLLRQLLEQ